jgi:CheY-specific phosphatase CheX
MPEELDLAVNTALMRVLETAAFMTVWPYQESDGELTAPDLAASMTFNGDHNGQLTLLVSSEVLPLLTQNILGELAEGMTPDEQGKDALKEILNMICGNLLTEWQGDQPIFRLSPPEIVSLEALAEVTEEAASCLRFNLENTLAVVQVREV